MPVVSPTARLSRFLIEIIKTYCNFHVKYSNINSVELVNKIPNIQFPPNAKLISFDVVSKLISDNPITRYD